MANALIRFRQAWTVLRKGLGDDIGFAAGEGGNTGLFSRQNLRLWLTGTHVDYARIAGPLWTNSAWASATMWLMRNLLQAPPVVQRKAGKTWETVEGHELPRLLHHPNDFYGWDALLTGLLISWFADGNGFALLERGRADQVVQLWYCPHWLIEPARRKGANQYQTHYNYYGVSGQRIELSMEQVAHVRFGIDPASPLRGYNPSGSIIREVASDVLATNFGAAALKNRGMIGAIATPKEMNQRFDPEEFAAKYRARTQGDQVGDILALDIPIELQFPDFTPDKMALDKIRQYPEARIASIFGLPPQVLGWIVGEATKTFSNYPESREIAWEESALPNGGMILRQLGQQLDPDEFADSAEMVLGLDISNVRPLQPDKDKLHLRVRGDYMAGIIDRYTALTETGREATEADKGVYFTRGGAPLDNSGTGDKTDSTQDTGNGKSAS